MSERLSWLGWVGQFVSSDQKRGSLLLLFALMSGGCSEPGFAIGQRAPEISGADVTGKTIKLSDYKGKVVLLDFWGTWCKPCIELIPDERNMMRKYGKRPFTILGICSDDPEALRTFLAKEPLPWPNMITNSGSLVARWGVESFPSWVLIDDEGVIQGRWKGGQNITKVEEAVDHAVQIAETR